MSSTATRLVTRVCVLALALFVPVAVASADVHPATTVTLAELRPTKTKVDCKPGALPAKSTSVCTATVSDTGSGKKVAPSGALTFASTGAGAFTATSCTLVGAATSASCAVSYTPARIGTGTHVISASYPGSETHGPSSASTKLGVTPPNDDRTAAEPLSAPPTSVDGTTVGSTRANSDPELRCAEIDGTVWYSYLARTTQQVALRLKAHGRLDAVVGVFQRVRSQVKPIGCAPTDEKGIAGIGFEASRHGRYLILVGERRGSAPSTFRLELFAPPLAHPPGDPLPRAGVRSTVDPLTKPQEAWSVVFRSGRTYRINLAPARGRCMSLALFAPKTKSFSDAWPLKETGCGGYVVFTPGPDGGGRYSLLVQAEESRGGAQPYRLEAAPAALDDIGPGLLVENGQVRTGTVSGRGVDVLDLYRFEVGHRSDVTLAYRAGPRLVFDLLLVSADGRRIDCACEATGSGKLRRQLEAGEYYFALRALRQSAGRYTVSLLIREITATTVLINGSSQAVTSPGSSVTLTALVTPSTASGGRIRLQVDRFDPIEGWQYVRLFVARVGSGGQTSVWWTPPAVGHWRLHAVFFGSKTASPSESRYAYLVVQPPSR